MNMDNKHFSPMRIRNMHFQAEHLENKAEVKGSPRGGVHHLLVRRIKQFKTSQNVVIQYMYIIPVSRVILRPWIKSNVSASHYLVFLVWSLNFNALLLLHCFMLKEHRIFANCIIVVSSYLICLYPLKPLKSNSYMDQSVTYAQKIEQFKSTLLSTFLWRSVRRWIS